VAFLLLSAMWSRPQHRRWLLWSGIAFGVSLAGWVAVVLLSQYGYGVWQELAERVGLTGVAIGVTAGLRAVLWWPIESPSENGSPDELGLSEPLKDGMASTTWLVSVIATLALLVLVWISPGYAAAEWLSRIATVGFLFVCWGTVLQYTRWHRDRGVVRVESPAELGEHAPLEITCPRCAHTLRIRANTSERCGECGVRFRMTVKEPRCACGYLLYGLAGDTCPECGRGISQRKGWAPQGEASAHPPLGDREPPPGAERD